MHGRIAWCNTLALHTQRNYNKTLKVYQNWSGSFIEKGSVRGQHHPQALTEKSLLFRSIGSSDPPPTKLDSIYGCGLIQRVIWPRGRHFWVRYWSGQRSSCSNYVRRNMTRMTIYAIRIIRQLVRWRFSDFKGNSTGCGISHLTLRYRDNTSYPHLYGWTVQFYISSQTHGAKAYISQYNQSALIMAKTRSEFLFWKCVLCASFGRTCFTSAGTDDCCHWFMIQSQRLYTGQVVK